MMSFEVFSDRRPVVLMALSHHSRLFMKVHKNQVSSIDVSTWPVNRLKSLGQWSSTGRSLAERPETQLTSLWCGLPWSRFIYTLLQSELCDGYVNWKNGHRETCL